MKTKAEYTSTSNILHLLSTHASIPHVEEVLLYMVEIQHHGMYMIRKYWCLISTKKTKIEKLDSIKNSFISQCRLAFTTSFQEFVCSFTLSSIPKKHKLKSKIPSKKFLHFATWINETLVVDW